ncbi:hypothetical protein KGM_208068 [Danaus plexippus plexippus]|uniref:Sm domain-containing protein n=1 Tax=Danaus plexippus plexippus TaxID=278856 RepID=A0A212FAL9_DANPL|nr:hypothetical protein KGM_208068 [Danaus plexippus plexippus]
MQIAGWGGVIVASTGFFLQNRLIENIRNTEHYKDALKTLRLNVGAVHYLGEPIKDKRIKLTDSENNNADETSARFCVPVTGPKDKGQLLLQLNNHTFQYYIRMFVGTSREKFFYHNTLLCLVKSLQNRNITVDLRDDSYVCGHLDTVDGFMNLSLSKAVYCDTRQNEFLFENFFIQSRNIRYVHIPEDISIIDNIKNEVHKENMKHTNPKPKKSRKATKALQQHMKTVAMLEK